MNVNIFKAICPEVQNISLLRQLDLENTTILAVEVEIVTSDYYFSFDLYCISF